MSVDFFFLNKGKYKYIHSNMIFYKKMHLVLYFN